MRTQHRIVIVGGGAGGLELATRLGNDLGKQQRAEIVLIEQKLTHIWKPLFHEVAAGTLDVDETQCYYEQHASKHHYRFVHARLNGIDTAHKHIQLQAAFNDVELPPLKYDTLILAVGSVSNDFGITGVKQHAYFLDQQHQAQNLQQILQSKMADLPRIAIVGAGATGVELAAQLKNKQPKAPIYLIEAATRILPTYTAKMSRYAQAELSKIGVQIYTQHSVLAVQIQQILMQDRLPIRADICIWTAGIQAPALFAELQQFERDQVNRIKVNASLQSLSHSDVFAMGDCANFQAHDALQALGARAQVASQQAEFLHQALAARLKGKRLPQFKFIDKGSLINLNPLSAVGELFQKVPVQGAVAKTMYLSLYPLHLVNIHGVAKAGLLSARHSTQQWLPWIKSNKAGT